MSSQDFTTSSLALNIQYHTIQGAFVQTIDARELHQQLGSSQQFANWITHRIEAYGFVKEVDYLFFTKVLKTPGRHEHVYILTFDMAKELCMLERSEMGRIARRYFIACEKALHGGAIAHRLDSIENRLDSLEGHKAETSQAQPEPIIRALTPPSLMPDAAPKKRSEYAHVSEHLLSIWSILRQADGPLSAQEIALQGKVTLAVVRKHTRYFVFLGLLEMFETAPRHLFQLFPDAAQRRPHYWQRLDLLMEVVANRQRRLFE